MTVIAMIKRSVDHSTFPPSPSCDAPTRLHVYASIDQLGELVLLA